MDIKEQTTEKRKARADHSLAWEARPGDPRNVDQTHYRVEVNVAGDRVSEWRAFWKTPEWFDAGARGAELLVHLHYHRAHRRVRQHRRVRIDPPHRQYPKRYGAMEGRHDDRRRGRCVVDGQPTPGKAI